MATDYRDDTGFSDGEHSIAEVAEAIRHKKYGKDVREAIAQGFENFDRITAEVSTLKEQLKTANEQINRLNKAVFEADYVNDDLDFNSEEHRAPMEINDTNLKSKEHQPFPHEIN